MGLLRALLTGPVSGPIQGALWVAQQIHEAADQQLHDPATLRAALQDLENQLLRGEITEAEYDTVEDTLLRRMQRHGS